MRKNLLSTLLLAAFAVLAVAAPSQAETLRPKVDNFILLFDHSGSMVLTSPDWSELKLKMAKELGVKMTSEIPELGYKSGVNTFAPSATQLAPTIFRRSAVIPAIESIDTKYDPYGRITPLGFGLDKIDPVIGSMSGRTALIIFTDGDSNFGSEPVAEAQALYNKYPNLCIHIVSYADKAHGKEVVAQIRALKGCSVAGDPKAMASEPGMRQFVRDVFYTVVPDEAPAPRAMAPAAVVASGACESITFGNLNFAFDKYLITKEMEPALEQASSLLKDSSCKSFTITGHTDSVGTDAYNQKLSERRANSVAKWIMQKGYSGQLNIVGKGKSVPKFDNKTSDGRYLNRRVEITTN
ncbi:MAG TPA: OmpA family protein [Humidesulfovibrio sp.]|uniref:OmpA family protein n=1 Tax=Humidesulfovibrio sp. TaxID=2910988 RepID=UPI002CA753CB|nr:OmpA family protein [Humidesulfovibrio sp.]HWR02493.1 OmpA family protein [Humidesulfovibrio sp.]